MGILALFTFEIIIGIAISTILFVFGLFFGYITIFESIVFGILGGISAHTFLHIHPALSIAIGIVIFLFFLWVQHTTVGFWIVCGILSVAWGFIFSLFAFSISNEDNIWTYTVWVLGTLVFMGLHMISKNKVVGR